MRDRKRRRTMRRGNRKGDGARVDEGSRSHKLLHEQRLGTRDWPPERSHNAMILGAWLEFERGSRPILGDGG